MLDRREIVTGGAFSVVGALGSAASFPVPAVAQERSSSGSSGFVHLADYDGVVQGAEVTTQLRQAWLDAADARVPVMLPGYPIRYEGEGLPPVLAGRLIGSGPSLSRVVLGPRSRLFNYSTSFERIEARDFSCDGGLGMFLFASRSANVAGEYVFENLVVQNYTQAGIASRSIDMPFLRVRRCQFIGANWTTSIGIAWGGRCDSTEIDENLFQKNRVHVKIGGGGTSLDGSGPNTLIRKNDFVWSGTGAASPPAPRARIWIVPSRTTGTESGLLAIRDNKFGPENLLFKDKHILIAAEDTASGTDRDTRLPSTAAATLGFVVDLTISGNEFGGSSAPKSHRPAPVFPAAVHTLTPNLVGYRFEDDNRWAGDPCLYFTEFDAACLSAGGNIAADQAGITRESHFGSARLPGRGVFLDPRYARNTNAWDVGHRDAHEGALHTYHEYPGGDDTGLAVVLKQNGTRWTRDPGVPTRRVIDARRRPLASEYRLKPGKSLHMPVAVGRLLPGEAGWVELELQASAVDALRWVTLSARDDRSVHFSRSIALGPRWRRTRIRWVPRAHRSWLNLYLEAPAVGRVKVGAVVIYHARDPLNLIR